MADMRLPMFKTKEDQAEWFLARAAQYEVELKRVREQLSKAQQGIGKESFLKSNYVKADDPNADKIWNDHIEWLRGNVKYIERKIRKFRRQAEQGVYA